MSKRTTVEIGGRRLSLSNLDKVLYPQAGFTKAEVIDYYARVAAVLVPHLAGRPVTLKRYPNGVEGGSFYEKRCPGHRPGWVRVAELDTSEDPISFCVVDDVATLIWLAQLASLELHPYLHLADQPDRPTVVVFDLDPGEPAGILECARVALWLRDLLGGVEAAAKTSGSKGLQVYLPVNRDVTYDDTKDFARAVARRLERDHPDAVVSRMAKELRRGKVFVDWSQNDQHKTTVGAYSLRARARPAVSTPVSWEEVAAAATGSTRLVFEAADVLARIDEHGDLFVPVIELEQSLPPI